MPLTLNRTMESVVSSPVDPPPLTRRPGSHAPCRSVLGEGGEIDGKGVEEWRRKEKYRKKLVEGRVCGGVKEGSRVCGMVKEGGGK